MPERKFALLIASSEYEDSYFRPLKAPAQDVEALRRVLSDPAMGAFDSVSVHLNQPSQSLILEIEEFFDHRKRDDLLLLYFSGHGIKDEQGRLYYAARNTRHTRLVATAIAAYQVNDLIGRSMSRRKVLLLDCCYSGAFSKAFLAKGDTSVGVMDEFRQGQGLVTLTASDAFQYSYEGEEVGPAGVCSVFTRALVEGIETGKADEDGDQLVGLDELYHYAYESVHREFPQQTPRRAGEVQGDIFIARTPVLPQPVELDPGLREAIQSVIVDARVRAADELNRLLRGRNKGLALTAHAELLKLRDDDSRRVSAAADSFLSAFEEAERLARERTEAEGQAAERAEAERRAREQAEREREARERAEQERLARERAEAERQAAARAEAERLAREQAERDREAEEREKDVGGPFQPLPEPWYKNPKVVSAARWAAFPFVCILVMIWAALRSNDGPPPYTPYTPSYSTPAGGTSCVPRPLELNRTTSGTLTSGACTEQQITPQGSGGIPAEHHRVTLTERGTLTLDLQSTAFDAYLMLLDASLRELARNDDHAGSRDARISLELGPGNYSVVARSLGPGVGAYTLITNFTPARRPAPEPPQRGPECPWWTLELDQEIRMTLSGSDCAVQQLLGSGADNDRAARYELKLSRRTPVVIDMRSTDFDPYLILLDANGNQIATDDDGGGGLNARIQRTLGPGAYVVLAKALESRQGTYFLHARAGP